MKRQNAINLPIIIGAIANFLLASLKTIIGFIGNSASLFADGVHSFSDLLTDALVFLSAKFSSKNKSDDYEYGFQRLETIATLFIGIALITVSYHLILEAYKHIFDEQEISIIGYVLGINIVSLIVKEGLYHYSKHMGEKWDAKILVANATHHRSDAAASMVVLIGVLGSIMGFKILDGVAALVVALLVVYFGLKLIYQSVCELMDKTVPAKSLKPILVELNKVHKVKSHRSRVLGNFISLEIKLDIANNVSYEELIKIKEEMNLIVKGKKVADLTISI
jgi:cation diffusion facilitator family transporter